MFSFRAGEVARSVGDARMPKQQGKGSREIHRERKALRADIVLSWLKPRPTKIQVP
jgi:hypothetical protein